MRSQSQVGAARQVLGLIVLSGSVCTTPVAAQCELNAVYVNEPDTLGDQFGFAVSISGDYAIVGAYLDTPPDPNPPPPVIEAAGAAYIVRRVGANWQVQQRLVAPEQQELAWFGYSVDIDGDYAVVGAPGHETNGLGAAGLVELFGWEEEEFNRRFEGSPIRRIGHERWLRNLAVGLGNAAGEAAGGKSGDPVIVAALRALAKDRSEVAYLGAAAYTHAVAHYTPASVVRRLRSVMGQPDSLGV